MHVFLFKKKNPVNIIFWTNLILLAIFNNIGIWLIQSKGICKFRVRWVPTFWLLDMFLYSGGGKEALKFLFCKGTKKAFLSEQYKKKRKQ